MSHNPTNSTLFTLEGRFLGFVSQQEHPLKFLRLSTATGEQLIKLPKALRSPLYRSLVPGEWLQVWGRYPSKSAKKRLNFKAEQVIAIAPSPKPDATEPFAAPVPAPVILEAIAPNQSSSATPRPETILICKKSDCCKRGGGQLAAALELELGDRGLSPQVTIKATGCMKRCKAGPNLVMPDKTRYTQIRPHDVSALLDKHFPLTAQAQPLVEPCHIAA